MNKVILAVLMLSIPFLCFSESKIVDQISWEDESGSHVIRIMEVNTGQYFESNWKSKILVEKKTMKNNIDKLTWDIVDYSKNPSEAISYVQNTLRIFDVDRDGVMESIFSYVIEIDGLDPNKLKQMVHKDNIKFAIRGGVPKRIADVDEYTIKIDKSFSTQSLELIKFSLDAWNEMVLKMFNRIE